MKSLIPQLPTMDRNAINQEALDRLDKLLDRCTINLVSQITGISRVTLYRWLDESLPLDAMNHRDAAWFILVCEYNPKAKMLLDRAPLTNPRLAKRLTDEVTENEDG